MIELKLNTNRFLNVNSSLVSAIPLAQQCLPKLDQEIDAMLSDDDQIADIRDMQPNASSFVEI